MSDGSEQASVESRTSAGTGRTYHVLGVPLRSGSLVPGSENDAQAYRDAGLLTRLQTAGCRATDHGDLAIPSYLPHHAIPPIRSWPGPRIVWELVGERIDPWLAAPGHVPLLIGCDCSIVVGTTAALLRTGAEVHVLYVDGDFDDAAPAAGRCQSAAAMAVWLLTRESAFWSGPPLPPSRVTVIGWSQPPQFPAAGVGSVSLAEVRRGGAQAAARAALAAVPASAHILLHVDIDVWRGSDLPAAYFPHTDGLSLAEGSALVGTLLQDPRLRLVEIAEYAALRDRDQQAIGQLLDLTVRGLAG
jgi:arginase family enzyme